MYKSKEHGARRTIMENNNKKKNKEPNPPIPYGI
jgi:hypothetical protein